MIFSNLFNARPYAQRLRQLVFKCLFDEQFEVRTVASVTLSGYYQCGYIQVNNDDLVSSFIFFDLNIFIDLMFCRNTFVWWVKQVISRRSMERKWHQQRTLSRDMAVSCTMNEREWSDVCVMIVRCAWSLCDSSIESIWYSRTCTRSIDVAVRTLTWSWSDSSMCLLWLKMKMDDWLIDWL